MGSKLDMMRGHIRRPRSATAAQGVRFRGGGRRGDVPLAWGWARVYKVTPPRDYEEPPGQGKAHPTAPDSTCDRIRKIRFCDMAMFAFPVLGR